MLAPPLNLRALVGELSAERDACKPLCINYPVGWCGDEKLPDPIGIGLSRAWWLTTRTEHPVHYDNDKPPVATPPPAR
jgi:hypothetical protein